MDKQVAITIDGNDYPIYYNNAVTERCIYNDRDQLENTIVNTGVTTTTTKYTYNDSNNLKEVTSIRKRLQPKAKNMKIMNPALAINSKDEVENTIFDYIGDRVVRVQSYKNNKPFHNETWNENNGIVTHTTEEINSDNKLITVDRIKNNIILSTETYQIQKNDNDSDNSKSNNMVSYAKYNEDGHPVEVGNRTQTIKNVYSNGKISTVYQYNNNEPDKVTVKKYLKDKNGRIKKIDTYYQNKKVETYLFNYKNDTTLYNFSVFNNDKNQLMKSYTINKNDNRYRVEKSETGFPIVHKINIDSKDDKTDLYGFAMSDDEYTCCKSGSKFTYINKDIRYIVSPDSVQANLVYDNHRYTFNSYKTATNNNTINFVGYLIIESLNSKGKKSSEVTYYFNFEPKNGNQYPQASAYFDIINYLTNKLGIDNEMLTIQNIYSSIINTSMNKYQ